MEGGNDWPTHLTGLHCYRCISGRALTAFGALTSRRGDVDDGMRCSLKRSACGATWRPGELAAALDALGWLLVYDAGDGRGALDVFEQSLELRRQQDDRFGDARTLVGVCQALVQRRGCTSGITVARSARSGRRWPRTEHFAYAFLGDCALIRQEFDAAEALIRESASRLPLGDVSRPAPRSRCGDGVSRCGDAHRALRLLGSVEALYGSVCYHAPILDELLATHIGAAVHCAEATRSGGGRSMTFDDAVLLHCPA